MKKPHTITGFDAQNLARLNAMLDELYGATDRRAAFRRPDGRSSVWGAEVDQTPSESATGAQRDRQIIFVEVGGTKTEVGSIDSAGNIRIRGVLTPNSTDVRSA